SCTRARQNGLGGTPAIPKPSIASKTRGSHLVGGMGGPYDVASFSPSQEDFVNTTLHLENESLRLEIEQLKTQLAQNEDTAAARHNDLMTMIWSMSPTAMDSPSAAAPSSLAPRPCLFLFCVLNIDGFFICSWIFSWFLCSY
ncbi:hypothetical protein HAX54_012355, partial [Datura stramonium]|nr:hypothetical protein [Datura stramonium]